MSNQILYIQRGNQLYNKNQGIIVANRGSHSLGGIKRKKITIIKVSQKKQQRYNRIIPEPSPNIVEINNSVEEISIEISIEIPNETSDETISTEYIPNENYTDLLPLDILQLLSNYKTTNNYGIIYITNVVLNTLINDTCSTVTRDLPFYNAFAFGTYLVLGKTYSLTVTICDINITYPGAIVSVWIDWNQTNSYCEEDWVQVSTNIPIGESGTIEIVVPTTAKIGTTGMRIRSRGASDGNKNGPRDAYVDMGSGDTQDYPITILSEEL
jgi:hypothetical protein